MIYAWNHVFYLVQIGKLLKQNSDNKWDGRNLQTIKWCRDVVTYILLPLVLGGLSSSFWKKVSHAKYIWTDKYNVLFYTCTCINFFWKHNIQVLNIWTGRCNALFYTMAISPFFWKHNLQVMEIWTDTYNALLHTQALSILFSKHSIQVLYIWTERHNVLF